MWRKPVTLQELEAMTSEQVLDKINEFLVPANRIVAPANPADLVAAQFYMAELDRRASRQLNKERQDADTKRDRIETVRHRVNLGLEFGIGVLIGLELWFGWREGDKQLFALNQIVQSMSATATTQQATQKNAEATASILGDLKITMDKVNGGIQNLLDLNYVVNVDLTYNNPERRLKVTNNGKTTIYWWGQRRGNDVFALFDKPVAIEPGPPIGLKFGDVLFSLQQEPKIPSRQVPIELYFKNERGEKFVSRAYALRKDEEGEPFAVEISPTETRRENWSEKSNVSKAPLTNH